MKRLRHLFALAPDCHAPVNYSHLAWRRHIYDGIRPRAELLVTPEGLDFGWARQGHQIDYSLFQPQRVQTSELLWRRIQSAHQTHGLDAVISYCFAFDVLPEVVRQTIELGVPWINFFCDSTHMFEKVEPLARIVSLNWFPESNALERYQALGVPCLCAPYAWAPQWLPDLSNRSVERAAAFVGLPTSNRITQLGWLRLLGCPVAIRGFAWTGGHRSPFYNPVPARKRFFKALLEPNLADKIVRRLLWPLVCPMAGGPLSDAEFGPFVQGSLVILGLNQGKDPQGRFSSYLKFRDMEFPGYGCCYLTEHNDDVPRVLEVGQEILTYRSAAEAAGHIRRLSRNPELARQIGRAGRRRILQDHHWGVRLQQLAKKL